MRSAGVWNSRYDEPPARPAPQGQAWSTVSVRPRYAPADIAMLLWRERGWMLAVFLTVLALGLLAVMQLPKTYAARSSLLVQLGQEYVYQPRAGDAARGAIPQTGEVVQSEAEILSSDALKLKVAQTVGFGAVDPKLGREWPGADAAKRRRIESAAVQAMTRNLTIATTPDTGVVRLTYKAKDPDSAALILNTLVTTYLQYRKQVFKDVTAPLLERQREAFEGRLQDADQAYQNFLLKNGLSDYDTEKTSLTTLYGALMDRKFQLDAGYRQAQSRLAALQGEAGTVPAEIDVQRDLDLSAPAQLLQLRVSRQDLLSRYKPDAPPVHEIDAKIAALQALIASGQGVGEKDKRLGANPVWQGLETQRIQAQADAASIGAQRDETARELEEVSKRQLRLNGLETQYQDLATTRDVLQSNIKDFATREEEARASGAIAHDSDDNIHVVERAQAPSRGQSLRAPAMAAVLLFAAFTAVCFGLLRVFLRPGLTTAGSASRTLGLPVLAVATVKA